MPPVELILMLDPPMIIESTQLDTHGMLSGVSFKPTAARSHCPVVQLNGFPLLLI